LIEVDEECVQNYIIKFLGHGDQNQIK